jgi:hypothetical protein
MLHPGLVSYSCFIHHQSFLFLTRGVNGIDIIRLSEETNYLVG